MAEVVPQNREKIVQRLRQQAGEDRLRVTLHGHQEMVEESVSYDDLRDALLSCTLVEDYPEHRRGPCCLVCGQSAEGRHLHVVCTTTLDVLVVITVYEPKPPKWTTPFERGA